MYDDLIEDIQVGNSELEEEMLDKILERFESNAKAKITKEGNRIKGEKPGKKLRKKTWGRGR